MAIRIDLPKEIIAQALQAKISTNNRNKNASTNDIIKQALEQENQKIAAAIATISETK